jgi:hypothetical protein
MPGIIGSPIIFKNRRSAHIQGGRLSAPAASLLRSSQLSSQMISKLKGPYFSFLLAERDAFWERRGRVQRIVGIKPEYYHQPDALHLPDCVISFVATSFERAHPRFNYYGYTVFESETLDRLIGELRFKVEVIMSCQDLLEFGRLPTELFVACCEESIGGWQKHWPEIKEEVVGAINRIILSAERAKQESKVLLVLGV